MRRREDARRRGLNERDAHLAGGFQRPHTGRDKEISPFWNRFKDRLPK